MPSRRKHRASSSPKRASSRRRGFGARAAACVLVLALLAALALVVGDSTYHACVMGWAPFIAGLALVLFAFVHARVLAAKVSVGQTRLESSCERGQRVPFSIDIANGSWLPSFNLQAVFYVEDLFGAVIHEETTSLVLAPHERLNIPLSVSFDHIGSYRAGLKEVRVSDFIGLFERSVAAGRPCDVCVTPRACDLAHMEYSDDTESENIRASRAVVADSLDYASVREYEWGDALKLIHWKLSSRGEGLMTRIFETYTNSTVAVVLDFAACDAFERVAEDVSDELMSAYDAVVESGLALANYALEQGLDTQLVYCDRYGERKSRFSWGDADMVDLVGDLPRIACSQELGQRTLDLLQGQIASQRAANNLVVASANVSPELVGALLFAKAQHRSPFLVAVVPRSLVGREKERYCAALTQLAGAGVGYAVVSSVDELAGEAGL